MLPLREVVLLVREVALRELLSEELSSLLPELSEPPLREVEALLRLLEVLVVLLLVAELRLVEVLLRLVEVLLLSLLLVETPELRRWCFWRPARRCWSP